MDSIFRECRKAAPSHMGTLHGWVKGYGHTAGASAREQFPISAELLISAGSSYNRVAVAFAYICMLVVSQG